MIIHVKVFVNGIKNYKKLSKEIMKRSRLRNEFLNTMSDPDRKAYNQQINYVVNLLRKEEKGILW